MSRWWSDWILILETLWDFFSSFLSNITCRSSAFVMSGERFHPCVCVCVCVCVFWLENNTYNKKKKVWYKESLRGTAKELPILPWLCVGLCFIKASPMVHQVKNLLAKQETQETRVRSLGQEDSLEDKNGNPFQYSCLKNSMERFAWRATVHGVAKVGHDWAPVRLCYHISS